MNPLLQVRVGCEFRFSAPAVTHAVLQVEPCRTDRASMLQEHWTLTPDTVRRGYRDLYGNLCQRLSLPAGAFSLRYDAVVEVPPEADDTDPSATEAWPGNLPDEALLYTLPSRYCLSDELADEAWRLFAQVAPGWGRVQAICDYVHGYLTFEYGASSPRTTAVDVYTKGRGVCRDYAHLAITLCRALHIPARYAFGYMPDLPTDQSPNDFCAWMEVWLGGRWYTFDPRNNEPRVGRVLVGRGRDALDCAMLTSYGNATLQEMTVWTTEVSPAEVPGSLR